MTDCLSSNIKLQSHACMALLIHIRERECVWVCLRARAFFFFFFEGVNAIECTQGVGKGRKGKIERLTSLFRKYFNLSTTTTYEKQLHNDFTQTTRTRATASSTCQRASNYSNVSEKGLPSNGNTQGNTGAGGWLQQRKRALQTTCHHGRHISHKPNTQQHWTALVTIRP